MNLQEILAKETLEDSDIQILMKNRDFLSDADLVRLGLKPTEEVPVVDAPAISETPAVEGGEVSTRRRRTLNK